jgi:hypothetical protein
MDNLNLLISLILRDKAWFCLSGMKIAKRYMTISELRRGIEQDIWGYEHSKGHPYC